VFNNIGYLINGKGLTVPHCLLRSILFYLFDPFWS